MAKTAISTSRRRYSVSQYPSPNASSELIFSALIGEYFSCDFLQAHRDLFPAVTQADKHQQSLSQVAQVYAQLVANGERVTSSKHLARAAHVRIDTALEFLRAERSQPDALA